MGPNGAVDDIGWCTTGGFHEGSGLCFLPQAPASRVGFTGAAKLLPQNNTLFGAALRTISRLPDNENSVLGSSAFA
jgi:hypothetical protein